MRDYLNIGSTPSGEDCIQVGAQDYSRISTIECKVFINQIRRALGEEQGTASLGIKTFQHDFGSYKEVVCFYGDNDEIGLSYAVKCESESPEYWDEKAKQELAKLKEVLTNESRRA